MRFGLTLLAASIAVSSIAVAQQTTTPTRVKPSNEFKVKTGSGEDVMRSSSPPPRATVPPGKDLENIERNTPKGSVSRSSKKVPAAVLPPEHDKPTPKINFKANGAAKNSGLVRQGANPLAGRLKDKGGKQ